MFQPVTYQIRRRHPRAAFPARYARPYAGKVFGADRIGLVGFHDRGFVIARPAEAHAPRLQQCALGLHEQVSGSSTNLTDGLRTALALVSHAPAGALRRIWLLTAGYPNRETDLRHGGFWSWTACTGCP